MLLTYRSFLARHKYKFRKLSLKRQKGKNQDCIEILEKQTQKSVKIPKTAHHQIWYHDLHAQQDFKPPLLAHYKNFLGDVVGLIGLNKPLRSASYHMIPGQALEHT
jgi:hypothetical protein